MTAPVTTIAAKIAALIAADSAFASLEKVVVGLLYRVPYQFYPYCEVFLDTETSEQIATGNKHRRRYDGVIVFNVRYQDIPDTSATVITVESYTTVQTLADSVIRLFKKAENRRLGNLLVQNGAVDEFVIGENQIEYGLGPEPGRTDNYRNQSAVPFHVFTLESMS